MDWHRSMRQVPRFYVVDPVSWRDVEPLDSVSGCKVTRDLESDGRESAQLTFDGMLVGEMWVRCYLDCEQDGKSERVPIGTWLVQSPKRSLGSAVSEVSAVAYSSLHVLREERLPVLWHAAAGSDCVSTAKDVCERYGTAPVLASKGSAKLADHYVAPIDKTALDVARVLSNAAGMDIGVDAMGRVLIHPAPKPDALLPSWTFRDDERSIMEPGVAEELDWYDVPNVCEVVSGNIVGKASNDDLSSILSTGSRGRRVVLRVENPEELRTGATQELADLVAARKLQEACATEHTLEVPHGMCPLKLGDGAEVDWRAMGLHMVGQVVRQQIDVTTGVAVVSTIKARSGRWGSQ